MIIADFRIHSRYSRAASRDKDISVLSCGAYGIKKTHNSIYSKILYIFVLFAIYGINTDCDTLITDRADNYSQKGSISIESGFEYYHLNWADNANVAYTRNDFLFPILINYGISEDMEVKIRTYYNIHSLNKINSPAETKNGLMPFEIQPKWNFFKNEALKGIAFAFSAILPLENPDKRLIGENIYHTGEGVNFKIMAVLTTAKLADSFIFNMNLAYLFNGKYTINGAEMEPANSVMIAGALTYSSSEALSFCGEIKSYFFNELRQNAAILRNSSGNIIDSCLSMTYIIGENAKCSLGFIFAAGKADYRIYDIGIKSKIGYNFNLFGQ